MGAAWAERFTQLELRHGLDINNVGHIWLLHILFLPLINSELSFFADSWNQHRIQIRDGPNRSPADMFGFDMYVHGVRGDQLPQEDSLDDEELEVFGVDWQALRDDRLLASQQSNNSDAEGWTSWVGQTGPPENLGGVSLDPPNGPMLPAQVDVLLASVQMWLGSPNDGDIVLLWTHGLAMARLMYPHLF